MANTSLTAIRICRPFRVERVQTATVILGNLGILAVAMTTELRTIAARIILGVLARMTVAIVVGSAAAQEQLSVVQDSRIRESSGMAISRLHNNAVWIHNDSGDDPRLFLVGFDGVTRGIVDVRNTRAVDWEDMCSFEIDGESWLLIGDVGDNQSRRTKNSSPCFLYLIREPPVRNNASRISRRCDIEIMFEYEDGPHDCESVTVDVWQSEILLLSKESPLTAAVYRLPLDLNRKNQSAVARKITSMPLPFATAADISADGRDFVAVTMLGGWICRRETEQTWDEAFRSTIHRFPLPPRRQGETVCFSRDGRSLFLNSEQRRQPLWKLDVESVRPSVN